MPTLIARWLFSVSALTFLFAIFAGTAQSAPWLYFWLCAMVAVCTGGCTGLYQHITLGAVDLPCVAALALTSAFALAVALGVLLNS